MDKIYKQIEISELLAAKVLGTLNEEQLKALENWEQQSNNKELAKEILNSESFSTWSQKLKHVDTEKEWFSFLEQMEDSAIKRKKVIRLRVIKWSSSIAAIFIIGAGIFTFYKKSSSTSHYQTIEMTSITPGGSHAELILSNGEVVDLENTSKKTLTEGEVSLNNNKGILEYGNTNDSKVLETKTNTLRIPRGGEYQLVLSDGTKVWLNSETELTFPVQFTGKERRVTLKGEAFFDVTHNNDIPFIVSSENQDVTVLGTQFNVSAYPDDNNVMTTLVRGKVKVSDSTTKDDVYLQPNEQSVLKKSTDYILKKSVDTYPYTAWKDGRFVFNNVTLEEFLQKVSRWYDVEIIYKDQSLKKLRFTGDLPRYSDMSSILKIIEIETSVNIKIENNKKIFIYK